MQIILSELCRGSATSSIHKMPNLDNLLAFVSNESKFDSREGSVEPQILREKVIGDAIRTNHTVSRIKTIAQKKRKASNKGKAHIGENPKRKKGVDMGIGMGVHLSDLIDEANVIYAEPSFPLPTPLSPIRDILSPRGVEGFPVVVHDIPNDSDSTRSSHDNFIPDDASAEPSMGANEKVMNDLPNLSTCSPETGMNSPTLSLREMEDVPIRPRDPRANRPDVPSGETSERKLPIRSLRDGLLGCPLEALQALAPESYLRRPGASKMSPERFADIIVHH